MSSINSVDSRWCIVYTKWEVWKLIRPQPPLEIYLFSSGWLDINSDKQHSLSHLLSNNTTWDPNLFNEWRSTRSIRKETRWQPHVCSASGHHQILHLPQTATLEFHQILRLTQKVTLEHHQIAHLPRKVTLELDQIMHVRRKMILKIISCLSYYLTLLLLESITWLYYNLTYYLTVLLLYSAMSFVYRKFLHLNSLFSHQNWENAS